PQYAQPPADPAGVSPRPWDGRADPPYRLKACPAGHTRGTQKLRRPWLMTVTGTYRLQLHEGFGFADAQAQLPFLASLGVSHLYLSPVLQAVPGSMHGYDVLDHTRISQDLGGEEGLRALAAAAREHDLGLVVDVVPNHMALVAPESANAPLWAVLREGRDAPTAHWFDIDWKSGGGRLGLPVFGSTLAETLEAGDLVLDELDGQPVIRYFEHVYPVALGTEGADVAEVLARQHYQLASWRESDRKSVV